MANGDLPDAIFVNTLTIHGFLNGNLNLAFGQARWFPQQQVDGDVKVAVVEPIVVDLRMDLRCAQQLHDALSRIIAENTKPQVTN